VNKSKIVVGDLHLHTGSDPAVSKDFARLLSSQPAGLLLVNGDLFDLDHVAKERKLGIHGTPDRVVRILDAFPDVVGSLKDWVSRGGKIVWLPGNHDAEICLPNVQALLRERLGLSEDQLRFEDHAHFQEGLWVEHGHQRDPGNRFHPDTPTAVAKERLSAFPLGCLMTRYLLCRIPQFTNRGDNYMTPLRVLIRVIKNHGLAAPGMVALYILSSYRIAWQAVLARRRGDADDSSDSPMQSPVRIFHRMYMDRVMLCILLVLIAVLGLTGLLEPILALILGVLGLVFLLWRPARKALYKNRDRKGCISAADELLKGEARVVVMGHCHHEESRSINGGTYLNQGAFHMPGDRGRPYVVIEPDSTRLDYIQPAG
jgi:UDP-2,3-diacylglucosamine pyrophosphatase LpxH